MTAIDPHARLQPGPGLLTSILTDDEVVILHPGTGLYFSLERVGAAVWRHLVTAPRTFAELTAFVEAHYAVSTEACRDDLAVFVEHLLGHDLLQRRDA